MNCVLLFPEEVTGKNSALVAGKRAKALIANHKITSAFETKISILNKGIGQGSIQLTAENELEISFDLDLKPPCREKITVISAVQRPQTIKKILQLCSSHGIEKIIFTITENTEKSYLQSNILRPENYIEEMYLGIEQSVDCFLPEIEIFSKYYSLINYIKQPDFTNHLKIFSDVPRIMDKKCIGQKIKLNSVDEDVIIAIGPESGWSDKEREDFSRSGFISYSLGKRIYRSEAALAMLFGQISQLRNLT